MILDEENAEVILNVSRKLKIDKNIVIDAVAAYHKGVQHIIEEKSPASIKFDFFGKLIFNNRRKSKEEDNA